MRQNTSAFLTNAYRIIYNHILELATQFDKVDHFILLEASYDTVKLRMNKRGRSQETIFHDKY
ncbi:MAG: hypothetical protein DRP42_02405 [Tenericutes bacterium]|nr:MAG: hypothetical protein DRP42_02405 [Mycoplasmatota bacterium]